MAVSCKGARFPKDVLRSWVRWYVAYPLSTCPVEERMAARGVHVGHATMHRWGSRDSPQLEEAFHRRKRPVRVRWRMEETDIRV
jgi:putative transposase